MRVTFFTPLSTHEEYGDTGHAEYGLAPYDERVERVARLRSQSTATQGFERRVGSVVTLMGRRRHTVPSSPVIHGRTGGRHFSKQQLARLHRL